MKTLHVIVALCIASSFSLNSMENEEYVGLKFYHPTYHNSFCSENELTCGSTIYSYCKSNKKDASCDILNAYLLLNRRPQESVEEQIKFYTKDLEATTSELNSTSDIFRKKDLNLRKSLLQSDIFRKKDLNLRKSLLQIVIPQIQQARLSGNLQDSTVQQQVDTALKNTLSTPNRYSMLFKNLCNPNYNQELILLREAVQHANDCQPITNNRDAFYNPNSHINSHRSRYDLSTYKDALYRKIDINSKCHMSEENNK